MKDWRKRLSNLCDNLVLIGWAIAFILIWWAGEIVYFYFSL